MTPSTEVEKQSSPQEKTVEFHNHTTDAISDSTMTLAQGENTATSIDNNVVVETPAEIRRSESPITDWIYKRIMPLLPKPLAPDNIRYLADSLREALSLGKRSADQGVANSTGNHVWEREGKERKIIALPSEKRSDKQNETFETISGHSHVLEKYPATLVHKKTLLNAPFIDLENVSDPQSRLIQPRLKKALTFIPVDVKSFESKDVERCKTAEIAPKVDNKEVKRARIDSEIDTKLMGEKMIALQRKVLMGPDLVHDVSRNPKKPKCVIKPLPRRLKCSDAKGLGNKIGKRTIVVPPSLELFPANGQLTSSVIPMSDYCNKCHGYSKMSSAERWIFCCGCGNSFHQSCAPQAPALDHPCGALLPPLHHFPWIWFCPTCRCCSKCKENERPAFTCRLCHSFYCSQCDENGSDKAGYYFVCTGCIRTGSIACLVCQIELDRGTVSRSIKLFCKSCAQLGSCPRCLQRYRPDDDSIPMICCDQCSSWTHALCAGLSPQQYDVIGDDDQQRFLCIKCSLPEQPPKVIESPESTHIRTGPLLIRYPASFLKDATVITYHRMYWSYARPLTRTMFTLCLTFNRQWKPIRIEIEIGDDPGNKIKVKSPQSYKAKKALRILKSRFKLPLININSLTHKQFFQSSLLEKVIENVFKKEALKQRKLLEACNRLKKPLQQVDVLPEPSSSARLREYKKQWRKPVAPSLSDLLEEDDEMAAINHLNASAQPILMVAKSGIAGLGLYALQPILAGCRIIEYCGEIIGQMMADRREKLYSLLPLRRNDCYLFRISPDCIVDATLRANQARFINHSCASNCESRIERARIYIVAKRDISAGEELTYDYMFSREEMGERVPCYCGATNCRKYMD